MNITFKATPLPMFAKTYDKKHKVNTSLQTTPCISSQT